MRRRALTDLAQRSRGGMFIHLPLWLVVGWTSGLDRAVPLYFWSATTVFAVLLALRLAFEARLAVQAAERPKRRWSFLVLMLTNPFNWGLLTSSSLMASELEAVRVPLLLVTVGAVAAGGMGLAINPVIRFGYPTVAIGPIVLSMALSPGLGTPFLFCAFTLFLAYLFGASKCVYADYWAAAHARLEIEARARQLERMSMTDALTQVHNRQFLDRQLEIEWRRAERDDRCNSLVMIDVDHFKRINDTYGHPFGDACLQAIAKALQAALSRPGDLVARYGGEEFAVLLPGIGHGGAALVAARLHRAVGDVALAFDGRPVPLTCSVGVHSAPVGDGSATTLIALADKALYAAKQQGRDRVVSSASLRIAEGA